MGENMYIFLALEICVIRSVRG